MNATRLTALACLMLGGCVTNTQTSQNQQVAPGGAPIAARSQPHRVVDPDALLAAAKLVTIHKATTAGATLVLGVVRSLDSGCAPDGDVVVKITAQPDHGTVHTEKAPSFSNYSPVNTHYVCNAKKTPATRITYQPASGYTGDDVAVIQVFYPNGQAPTFRFNISVDGSF